jgi:glycosyltransferase involved in cell wall biosynthesis
MDRLAGKTGAPCAPPSVAFYADSDAWPGGAETWLTSLMLGLRSAAWRVSLFLSARDATDPWAELLVAGGVNVTRVRPMREIDPAARREAVRVLRGFTLVHVNKTHPRSCLPVMAAARRAGARALVSSEHVVAAPASRYPLGREVVRHLVRRANALCDVVTVPSDASRAAYLDAYDTSPSKVVTVRGAVDLEPFDRQGDAAGVRRDLGLGSGDKVAAVVGRLHSGKGIEHAIRAAQLIREKEPAFSLLVVGSGPLAGAAGKLAQDCGLSDAVVFAGSRADVPSILASVDLLVVPSESETAGLAAIEGMAASLPVVATDVGGLPEAVENGVTGILVPPTDPGAIANAVLRILAEPERARRMGAAGRARVEADFSVERLVSTVAGLYARLLRTEDE